MAAIGQSNPLPIHGPLWFDAREFGVSIHNPDNGPALQAAHDAAAAALAAYSSLALSGTGLIATVFIPAAPGIYTVKTPVFVDSGNVEFRGEKTTLLASANNLDYPIFIVGIPRVGSGNVPNATYRPDLWNGGSAKLDTSVVTAANQKWGFRSNGDGFVVSQASTLSHGPLVPVAGTGNSWPSNWFTQQVTIEFAIEGFSGGQVPSGCAFGLGSGTAAPFVVGTTGTNFFRVIVATQPAQFGPVTSYTLTFSSGAATGVQRIAVQIDLVAGAVTAFVNGTQVAVTGTQPAAGVFLNENPYWPFVINTTTGVNIGSGQDFAIYGLALSASVRYANNGVGQPAVAHPQFSGTSSNGSGSVLFNAPGTPTGGTFTITANGSTTSPISVATLTAGQLQTTLQGLGINTTVTASGTSFNITATSGNTFDPVAGMCNGSSLTGATIRDQYRYYPGQSVNETSYDGYLVGNLGFAENPTTAPRHLSVAGGPNCALGSATSALLLNTHTLDPLLSNNVFTDISVRGDVNFGYGMCIQLGHVLYTTLQGITAVGGLYGIGNFPYGANYGITVRDCTLQGTDAAYFAYWSLIQMDNITIINGNRNVFRGTGSSFKVKNVFVIFPGADSRTFAMLGSGGYSGGNWFENVNVDNEGGDPYKLAFFYCEPAGDANTQLVAYNISAGNIGSVPLFKLPDVATPPNTGIAMIDANWVVGGTVGAIVDTDGPVWTGRIRNSFNNQGSYLTSTQAVGPPGIVVEDTRSLTFPRYGTWIPATVDIEPPRPADGQYREVVVSGAQAGGTVGSATPPQWQGLREVQASTNASLAAYAIDHTAISATLSGQASSYGYLTGPGVAAISNALFGGATIGGNTVLTLAGTGLGGTYSLTYGGQTASGIAPTAAASTIQTALQGLSSIGSGNATVSGNAGGPYTITLGGSLAKLAGGANGFTVNASGLTGAGASASLYCANVPATWYFGLSTAAAFRPGTGVVEPRNVGYSRVAVANNTTNFPASSAGSKSSAVAVTFPAATAPYTVQSIAIFDSPTNTVAAAVIQLASPLQVATSATPTISSGGLAFTHTPYPGPCWGTMTDYAWGKAYDLLFGATTFTVPSTWYAALSTAVLARTSVSATEPVSNGYARAAAASNTTNFSVYSENYWYGQPGDVFNSTAIAFGSPTGTWGTCVAAALADASSGGNLWFVAPLTAPVSPSAGTPAPTFAARALTLASG